MRIGLLKNNPLNEFSIGLADSHSGLMFSTANLLDSAEIKKFIPEETTKNQEKLANSLQKNMNEVFLPDAEKHKTSTTFNLDELASNFENSE